jgi:hypothetical protein
MLVLRHKTRRPRLQPRQVRSIQPRGMHPLDGRFVLGGHVPLFKAFHGGEEVIDVFYGAFDPDLAITGQDGVDTVEWVVLNVGMLMWMGLG